MSTSSAQHLSNVLAPVYGQKRSLSWQAFAAFVGSLFLAISSYIEVSMVPVPITMQTYAILLVAALYGWRLGVFTIVLFLCEGAAGFPVFAGGAGGYLHFIGPTGGYLFSWPLVGGIVGWLAERGFNGQRPFLAFFAMLLGSALCLLLGAAWLAVSIGMTKAVGYGILPFLAGDVLKCALAAATLKGLALVRERLSLP